MTPISIICLLIVIIGISIYLIILILGLITGKIYTKWGMYTGKWFIDKKEEPEKFWNKFYLYLAMIIIIIIFSAILIIYLEV